MKFRCFPSTASDKWRFVVVVYPLEQDRVARQVSQVSHLHLLMKRASPSDHGPLAAARRSPPPKPTLFMVCIDRVLPLRRRPAKPSPPMALGLKLTPALIEERRKTPRTRSPSPRLVPLHSIGSPAPRLEQGEREYRPLAPCGRRGTTFGKRPHFIGQSLLHLFTALVLNL